MRPSLCTVLIAPVSSSNRDRAPCGSGVGMDGRRRAGGDDCNLLRRPRAGAMAATTLAQLEKPAARVSREILDTAATVRTGN
jgi:hypothetical protein